MEHAMQLLAELYTQFSGPNFLGGAVVTLGSIYFGPDRLSAMLNRSSEVAKVAHEVLNEAADQADDSK